MKILYYLIFINQIKKNENNNKINEEIFVKDNDNYEEDNKEISNIIPVSSVEIVNYLNEITDNDKKKNNDQKILNISISDMINNNGETETENEKYRVIDLNENDSEKNESDLEKVKREKEINKEKLEKDNENKEIKNDIINDNDNNNELINK